MLAFRDLRPDADSAAIAKRDKSLGFLAQRFVQLFLVGRDVLALEHAAKILMAAQGLDASTVDPTEATFKTRVRRLYDVANVLQSLRLVTKVTFTEASCARKPAFAWRGLGAVPLLPGIPSAAATAEIYATMARIGMHERQAETASDLETASGTKAVGKVFDCQQAKSVPDNIHVADKQCSETIERDNLSKHGSLRSNRPDRA